MTIGKTLSILLLASLLFFPVAKIIWVLSARRLHRRLKRELTADVVKVQQQRPSGYDPGGTAVFLSVPPSCTEFDLWMTACTDF